MKKAPKIFPSLPWPYSIPFLSVLHQNKAFHGFRKKGQRSIVEQYRSRICPGTTINITIKSTKF